MLFNVVHKLPLFTEMPNGNGEQVTWWLNLASWLVIEGSSWRCCTSVDAWGVFQRHCGAQKHCFSNNNGQEFGDFTNRLKYQRRKKKESVNVYMWKREVFENSNVLQSDNTSPPFEILTIRNAWKVKFARNTVSWIQKIVILTQCLWLVPCRFCCRGRTQVCCGSTPCPALRGSPTTAGA